MQPLYDSWSLSPPPIPRRSRLYVLEPMGVGTALVESLTGYTARLAEAHSVSVGDLVGRVLSELAGSNDPMITAAAKAVRIGGHGFRARNYAINGVTDQAMKWVHALETATSLEDLQFLTLLPLRHVLSENLFRRHRAWCAYCYDRWRANNQIVYEPLIWSIDMSSYCSTHVRPLDHTCPHCARTLSPLGVFSRPGYCERCEGWLGMPDTNSNQSSSTTSIAESAAWESTQVGDLLAMLPMVNAATVRESFRKSLAVYLDQIADGNVLALAQKTHCPPCVMKNWIEGATVPRLDNLLRTCRFLNIPASSLFNSSAPTQANIAAAKEAIALTGSRGVSPSRTASNIRQALLTALDETVPLSLSEVAQKLDYKSTERLYQADRILCHKIAARHRQSGQSHWWKKPGAVRICEAAQLKEILEQSLKSHESISVHQIAENLGYSNSGFIHRKFPELCGAIREKIAHAKQFRPERMRRTLKQALCEHPAPTLVDLSRRLGFSSSSVLRTHEPALCNKLAARHRACLMKRRADVEAEAKATLGEDPVPSVRDVCKRLEITVWFMNKYLPAVRRMIAVQHRQCVATETKRQRDLLFHGIHCIVAEIQSCGLSPTVSRVVERIPEGSRSNWKFITSATRQARKVLCISK